jgi:diaminopimelate dehydrogenase
MNEKIKIGIVGYGNLGKGVELAIKQSNDLEIKAIFTRRNPSEIKSNSKILHMSEMLNYKEDIDVMILCGGSAKDLPIQSPQIVENFNIIDSFDNHEKIPEHFNNVNKIAEKSGKIGLISVGWDPGIFSLNRLLGEVVLPLGKSYTFWGKGVSQGHSDAIRRVKGVKHGVEYTIPIEEAINKVRKVEFPDFTPREKHRRRCYVVPEDGADLKNIESEIKNMPSYFSDYETTVNFITEDEFNKNHKGISHGGFVIRAGITGEDSKQIMEFNIKIESNPEFTASILVAYARAVYRLNKEGQSGALTIFDIPFSYLSQKSGYHVRKYLL